MYHADPTQTRGAVKTPLQLWAPRSVISTSTAQPLFTAAVHQWQSTLTSSATPNPAMRGEQPFTVESGRVIPGRALLANVLNLKNTSDGTNSDSTSCQTCHNTAIGAGVGVPLGVLALLFVIWAIIERRRASRLSRALSAPVPMNSAPIRLQTENIELSGHTRKRNNMVELEGGRPELDGGESGRG
ncbi:hypothetical protein N7536_004811 [Penicillium majusculum]|nr:hypothetical protein N7536_004811 [Penicillium majusculum]